MLNKEGNGVQCQKCKQKIYSVHVHDMHFCKCGTTFVDGGLEYLRYGSSGKTPKIVSRPKTRKK